MIARRSALEISVEQVKSLLGEITAALRQWTKARFPLPEDEAFDVHFVKDQPWGGRAKSSCGRCLDWQPASQLRSTCSD
jgi:hypothetical protein